MQIHKPKYGPILDTRRATKQNTYPVKLRINYCKNIKTFLCNYDLSIEDFDLVYNLSLLKKISDTQKKLYFLVNCIQLVNSKRFPPH